MILNHSRAILDDCRHLLSELRQHPSEASWRTRWLATVVMLRAVGHVLEHEIKNSNDAEPRKVAQRWWKSLSEAAPEPAIFWQFIYDDRNALLKQYSFSASSASPRHRTAASQAHRARANPMPGFSPLGMDMFDETPSYEMVLSPFTGCDARDVVEMAILWWDRQLQAIESGTA